MSIPAKRMEVWGSPGFGEEQGIRWERRVIGRLDTCSGGPYLLTEEGHWVQCTDT